MTVNQHQTTSWAQGHRCVLCGRTWDLDDDPPEHCLDVLSPFKKEAYDEDYIARVEQEADAAASVLVVPAPEPKEYISLGHELVDLCLKMALTRFSAKYDFELRQDSGETTSVTYYWDGLDLYPRPPESPSSKPFKIVGTMTVITLDEVVIIGADHIVTVHAEGIRWYDAKARMAPGAATKYVLSFQVSPTARVEMFYDQQADAIHHMQRLSSLKNLGMSLYLADYDLHRRIKKTNVIM